MIGTRFLKKIIQVYAYFKIYVILIAEEEEEEEEELGMSNELTHVLCIHTPLTSSLSFVAQQPVNWMIT